MTLTKIHIFIFCLILLSTTAQGSFYIRPEGIYTKVNDLDNGLKTNKTQLSLEANLGYMVRENYVLGITYGKTNTNTTYKSSTIDSKQIEDISAIGLEFGMLNPSSGGWVILGTYFPIASMEFKDGTDKFSGTGFQLKIGYGLKLSSTVLTLNVNYRSLTFDEYQGDKVANAYKRQGLYPSIGLIISF